MVRGEPVRLFPSNRDQRDYSGWLWAATTRSLVGQEKSLLERDRVWLADFDPTVRWIASQPFWLSGRDGTTLRRHVPDFLLEHVDGSYTVVDVKPEELLTTPEVTAVLAWTAHLCSAEGWRYEIWSGGDPIRLRNLRFLAARRRLTFSTRTPSSIETAGIAAERRQASTSAWESESGSTGKVAVIGLSAGEARDAHRSHNAPGTTAREVEIPGVVTAGLTTRQQTQLAARVDVLRGVP